MCANFKWSEAHFRNFIDFFGFAFAELKKSAKLKKKMFQFITIYRTWGQSLIFRRVSYMHSISTTRKCVHVKNEKKKMVKSIHSSLRAQNLKAGWSEIFCLTPCIIYVRVFVKTHRTRRPLLRFRPEWSLIVHWTLFNDFIFTDLSLRPRLSPTKTPGPVCIRYSVTRCVVIYTRLSVTRSDGVLNFFFLHNRLRRYVHTHLWRYRYRIIVSRPVLLHFSYTPSANANRVKTESTCSWCIPRTKNSPGGVLNSGNSVEFTYCHCVYITILNTMCVYCSAS